MNLPKIDSVNKYLYVQGNATYIRILGFLGLISSLLVTYGMARYFNLSIWYWIFFGPTILLITFSRIIRFLLQMSYPKFDIKKHEQFIHEFWNNRGQDPSVDVFLPYAGESTEVFEVTLQGVKNLEYTNLEVYILDDSGNPEVEVLASKYNFNYLSRPNKGEHRKSGNLQYGYDHSNGEFVFVLDADFIPARDALRHTIPYIFSNPNIGILQTPQYFEQTKKLHKDSPIQFGGGNIVEDFYRIDMPGRDRFGAALCVGTSAIYRREAILKAGGTPKVSGTEDVRQGLLITQFGYYVKYLPLIVSIGDSPDTLQAYFRQHNRWCSGSIETIFGEYFIKAKLSIFGKIIYLTNATYYVTEALSVVFAFHLLTLLYFHYDSLSLVNTLWFLPYFVYYYFLLPMNRVNKQKFGTLVAAMSNAYAYLYTIPTIPLRKVLPWEPAGVKQSKIHGAYNTTVNLGLILSSSFLGLFAAVLIERPQLLLNYNAYPTLIWALYSAFWCVTFLFMATKFIKNKRMVEILEHRWHKRTAHEALLHAKNYAMPLLFVFVLAIAAVNAEIQLYDRKLSQLTIPNSLQQDKLQDLNSGKLANSETPQVSAEDSFPSQYSLLAKNGDSEWSLSKTAVSRYVQESSRAISDAQIEEATYWLVLATRGKKVLQPGDNRVIAVADVEKAVGKAYQGHRP